MLIKRITLDFAGDLFLPDQQFTMPSTPPFSDTRQVLPTLSSIEGMQSNTLGEDQSIDYSDKRLPCGSHEVNKKLCPDDESGCHDLAGGGHVCLCGDLMEADKKFGCDRSLVNTTSISPTHFIGGNATGSVSDGNQLSPKGEGTGIGLGNFVNYNINTVNENEKADDFGLLHTMLLVSFLLAVIISIIIIILSRKKMIRMNSRRNRSLASHQQPPSQGSLAKCIERYVNNPNYHAGESLTRLITHIAIPADKVSFSEKDKIGEGAFGRVFKGVYKTSTESRQVAIKVLKSGLSIESQNDFEHEIEILSSFNHPNIVKLLGIFTMEGNENTMPAIVFEYMGSGDLAEFLRSHAPKTKSLETTANEINPHQVLQKNDLVWISAQIANGMKYLAGQHFVHRDLATRNCLVGDNLTVKISDFGMSRDIYTCDYYKVSGTRLLPVRWMSPESILYGKFTLESDVWSFGVVLWEIFTHGKQPYYGHSNEEVVKLILQGILLIPPDECPDFIYKLMASTWKTEPRDRISFSDIVQVFVKHCDKSSKGLLLNQEKDTRQDDSQLLLVNDNKQQTVTTAIIEKELSKEKNRQSLRDSNEAEDGHHSNGKNTDRGSKNKKKKKSNLKKDDDRGKKGHHHHPKRKTDHQENQTKDHDSEKADDEGNQERSQGTQLEEQNDTKNKKTELSLDVGRSTDVTSQEHDDNNYLLPLELQEVVVHPQD